MNFIEWRHSFPNRAVSELLSFAGVILPVPSLSLAIGLDGVRLRTELREET